MKVDFLSQSKDMLGRVFFPRSTPIKAWALRAVGVGLIGSDRSMKYHQFLKDRIGKPIEIDQNDFHLELIVVEKKPPLIIKVIEYVLRKFFFFLPSPKEIVVPGFLPSPLLKDVKEGDALQFQWDGRWVEYTFVQQKHGFAPCNFEGAFKEAKAELEEKITKQQPYLFEEDIPSEMKTVGYKVLTENALIYCHHGKFTSISKEQIAKFNEMRKSAEHAMRIAERKSDTLMLKFENPGVNDLLIVVDNHSVFAISDRQKSINGIAGAILVQERPRYLAMEFISEQEILPQTLEWKKGNAGFDSITVKFKTE